MLDDAPFSPPARLPSGTRRVVLGGGVARAEREKAGELSGVRGEERLAGQHDSAAAGAEAAQLACGPGRGDGAPPLPRPHQRGGPAGKPPRGGGRGTACVWVGGRSPGPRVAPGLLPRAPGFSHSLSHSLNQSRRRRMKPFALSFPCAPK